MKLWNDSVYTDEKVNAVYQYVSKKCMIQDLCKAGVVVLDSGKFSKEKIAGKTYDKCIVRFKVLGESKQPNCWQDKTLMTKYQQYYKFRIEENGRNDICYLTGEKDVISDNHPKGILPASYGAKLISANDSTDFTFRGRFKTGEEAYAVGYETTQKAHNALKWLAKEQGYIIGVSDKRTFICWNPKGKRCHPLMISLEMLNLKRKIAL